MKTFTDSKGQTYGLDQVVAVEQGGTPHPDLKLAAEPTAVLIYGGGARVQVRAPFSQVMAAWNPPTPAELARIAQQAAKVAADAAAAAKAAQDDADKVIAAAAAAAAGKPAGVVDAPAGLVDAQGQLAK